MFAGHVKVGATGSGTEAKVKVVVPSLPLYPASRMNSCSPGATQSSVIKDSVPGPPLSSQASSTGEEQFPVKTLNTGSKLELPVEIVKRRGTVDELVAVYQTSSESKKPQELMADPVAPTLVAAVVPSESVVAEEQASFAGPGLGGLVIENVPGQGLVGV